MQISLAIMPPFKVHVIVSWTLLTPLTLLHGLLSWCVVKRESLLGGYNQAHCTVMQKGQSASKQFSVWFILLLFQRWPFIIININTSHGQKPFVTCWTKLTYANENSSLWYYCNGSENSLKVSCDTWSIGDGTKIMASKAEGYHFNHKAKIPYAKEPTKIHMQIL